VYQPWLWLGFSGLVKVRVKVWSGDDEFGLVDDDDDDDEGLWRLFSEFKMKR